MRTTIFVYVLCCEEIFLKERKWKMAKLNLNRVVLSNMSSKDVFGLDTQAERLRQLMLGLVESRKSGSVLLMGASKSGKSCLVNSVLSEFVEQVDCITLEGVVEKELNKMDAIKSIYRQMKGLQTSDEPMANNKFSSFTDHLEFVLNRVLSLSRPLVFVLEKLECFCSSPKQTLLYHLMNMTHLDSRPVLVIGMTTRLDVVECLEKRVKSRFSHTIIHINKPNDCDHHLKAFKYVLSIKNDNQKAQIHKWNSKIDQLLEDDKMRLLLSGICHLDPSVATLKHLAHIALATNKKHTSPPTYQDFDLAWRVLSASVLDALLRGLSVLDMTLLITTINILRLEDEQDTQSVNFAQVFHEYRRFAQIKCSAILTKSKGSLMRSWEQLIESSILHPLDRGGGHKVLKEHRPYRLTILMGDIERVVLASKNLPTDVKEWIKTGIVN